MTVVDRLPDVSATAVDSYYSVTTTPSSLQFALYRDCSEVVKGVVMLWLLDCIFLYKSRPVAPLVANAEIPLCCRVPGVVSVMHCFIKEHAPRIWSLPLPASPEHTCRVSNTDHPKEVTQHAMITFVWFKLIRCLYFLQITRPLTIGW
jgi:hypothetical protein